MSPENSIQKSYLNIDVALMTIYTIIYKKYFTHLGDEGGKEVVFGSPVL